MRNKQITNENVWSTDFATAERRSALAKIQCEFKPKADQQRTHGAGYGVWMTDVSGNDKRSVKAFLTGCGDMRAAWWNFCSYVLQKVNNYSLEHAMCDFHRGHHGVYFFVLETTMLIKISILRQRTKLLPKTCPSVLTSTTKSVPQSDEI